jgi:hypothetical protein
MSADEMRRMVERLVLGAPEGGRALVPPTFGELLRAMIADEGSNRAAARAIGVSESTVRRWLRGTTPRQTTRLRFDAADRRHRARDLRDEDIRLTVFRQERRRDRRSSEINHRQLGMAPGAGARIADAYVSGGADQAAAQFLAEVQTQWYHDRMEEWAEDTDQGDYGVSFS